MRRVRLLLGEHQPRDQRGSLLLHRRDGVRVRVERDGDGRVAETLTNDLGMDARLKRQRRANEVLRNVFEAPLAHVRCYGDLITAVYTGSDEDTDGAFATLSQEGLVDLKGDWTELIRAATP